MHIKWKHRYALGTLYQHSATLTPHLVVSPFFVLERETGSCLWEQPESAERSAMLYPRVLEDGVIVAEKCEIDGRGVTFRGIVRIDAATGALLSSGGSDGVSPARGIAAASAWLRIRRTQPGNLDMAQLLDVRAGVITTRSGDVIDVRSGAIVRKVKVAADVVPEWTTGPNPDANAPVIALPGIGELLPGSPTESNETTRVSERFRRSWPLVFHLRRGGETVWVYDDVESKLAGLTGSLTYDKLRAPYAYYLLYKMKPNAFDAVRDLIFDLTLRTLDLRTGDVLGNVPIAQGPLHKWPSIADVDDRGILVMYREADANRSTVVYVNNTASSAA